MTGVTKRDVLQNMMTYGLFTGALVMHYGAEKVGCLVIPAGPGNSEKQLLLMQDFRTTVIHVTPSYALYLADFLQKKGVDPRRDLALRKAFVGAEPYTEETRRKIEQALGIDVYNSYGLSEMNGPGNRLRMRTQVRHAFWEDNFLVEILDPRTGEPLPERTNGRVGADHPLPRIRPSRRASAGRPGPFVAKRLRYQVDSPLVELDRRDVETGIAERECECLNGSPADAP